MPDKLKVSVITLHTVKNYGSVLQTWATQRKFEQLGCEIEFVDYWRRSNLDSNLLNEFVKQSEKWNKNKLTRRVYKILKTPSIRKRIETFDGFLSKYIHLTDRRYLTLEELKKDPPQADVYCTGSDQTWNSEWNGGIEKPFFLDYAPVGKKRISYSASFGRTGLDDWEIAQTRELLQKYEAISVRGNKGVKILSSMGIDSVRLFDPTLALDRVEWKPLIAERQVKKRYILIYQLNKNTEFDKYAKLLTRQKGLELIRLSYDYSHILKSGRLICCPRVEEFLSLFYYADYVITDSFHGVAFCINFEKKFAAVCPPKYSSRLKDILEITGLSDHVLKGFRDFSVVDKPIDYNRRVNKILDAERKRTDKFLKLALYGDNQ